MKILPRYLVLGLFSVAISAGVAGCKSNQNTPDNAQNQPQDQNPSQDPAAANVAPISNASAQSGSASSPDQSSDQYASDQYPQGQDSDYNNYDQPVDYAPQAPPPLPEYDQPPCPGDDYMWTPGYWNYASDGYYWVPGAWVYAPYQGALWTPGYWSYNNNRYGWHRGYWGRHIGYYGGINYGFGYVGSGYQGGYWNGDQFAYNRTVNNVNTTVVRNVYNYRVVNNNVTRVSYNGPGGVQARPRPAEIAALHEQHTPPMTAQVQQVKAAQSNRANFAAVNHGRPQTVAVAQPLPADHNIRPPAPVAMRNQPAQANAPRAEQPVERPVPQPQPRVNEPARPGQPATNTKPEPRQQQPTREQQQRPAPVQHPQQQGAPERQAPPQQRQQAPPQRTEQQRPAPVERPQSQPPAQHAAPPQHAAPAKPVQEHKPAPQPRPEEKEKKPQ